MRSLHLRFCWFATTCMLIYCMRVQQTPVDAVNGMILFGITSMFLVGATIAKAVEDLKGK